MLPAAVNALESVLPTAAMGDSLASSRAPLGPSSVHAPGGCMVLLVSARSRVGAVGGTNEVITVERWIVKWS